MKHLRKFENFSNPMDLTGRLLNNQCEKCECDPCNCQECCKECECDPCECEKCCQECECDPCECDSNGNQIEWHNIPGDNDIPGNAYEDRIKIGESNLIMFKDFINEKKKGEIKGLQKYLDEKSGKKSKNDDKDDKDNKKSKNKSEMPDFPDVDKDGDKKEPIKKAYKEAKAKKK